MDQANANVPVLIKSPSSNAEIDAVELSNSNIPAEIKSDMKITDAMRRILCDTYGCSIAEDETKWYITERADGTTGNPEITSDTVLNAGDKIELSITLTANEGYEFAAKKSKRHIWQR